jgi:pilus assembly protein CpaB
MKLFRNKYVIGILCILVGILISFAALPALQGNMQGTYASAVRMKETVQAGTQITADMVETVSIPQSLIQDGIGNVTDAAGKYANTELYAGDYLTNAKVSATLSGQNALSAGTEKGKMVISVTVPSLAAGVSGRLQPWDVVSVIAVPKATVNQTLGVEPGTGGQSNSEAVVYPDLQYLEVCMVTASDGSDADVTGKPGKDEKNSLPATVSFYVSNEQALRLAELEQNSMIDLAFVARGEAAAQYIPDAQRVFNTEVK